MRILVTGGAGFIGSHLVRGLIQGGHQVLNIDALTHAGSEQSLADLANEAHHTLLKADICNEVAMREAFVDFEPDHVIHLAAESHVDRSIESPRRFMETNIMGSYVLLQETLRYWQQLPQDSSSQFRLLHVSTDEVYGSVDAPDSFHESTPYAPRSPYSASKAAADHLVRAWHHTYGLPILISHSSNSHGSHQTPDKLIPRIIHHALNDQPIPIYGDGQQVRDWIHVGDHVEALQQILAKGQPGESYNIGGNDPRTNIELAHLICSILDKRKARSDGASYADQIEFVADRPGHDSRYAVDASKALKELGWRPQRDPQEAFQDTVQWHLDHQDWTQTMLAKIASP